MSTLNPGAGSVLVMAVGLSRGQTRKGTSCNVWWHSSSSMVVALSKVTHSHTSCLERFMTSVANDTPMASGGGEDNCFICTVGICHKVAQW